MKTAFCKFPSSFLFFFRAALLTNTLLLGSRLLLQLGYVSELGLDSVND